MLSEIFYWALNISIIGGITGLMVLVLRRIRKLPRFTIYLLWTLPLIRLWIPFGISNPLSFLNILSRYTTKTVIVWNNPQFSIANSIQAANNYFPIVYKTSLLENVFRVASLVWIVIATAAIMTALLLYFFTKSELENAVRIKDNIYQSDRITSPAVYGVFHPKIIIPTSLINGEINYILLHEQVHIKRKDNLWKVFAIITACLHWFNPLVWVMLKSFFADMELACDTRVIKNLDQKQTNEYATAILYAANGKAFFASAFGGAKTKVRIENILSYKKLTIFSSVCLATFFVVLVIISLTNAIT